MLRLRSAEQRVVRNDSYACNQDQCRPRADSLAIVTASSSFITGLIELHQTETFCKNCFSRAGPNNGSPFARRGAFAVIDNDPAEQGVSPANRGEDAPLKLEQFLPYRLNVLATVV